MEHAEATDPELLRRSTRQRSAIHHAINHAGQPLLPAEILTAAQQAIPALGMATVYRNIKLLIDAGEVQAVELPGEPARYESTHHGHHHHFQCRVCQQVFDVHGCPGDLAQFAPAGFQVERHELTLYGVCSGCNQA